MRVSEYREWAAPLPDEERWELIAGVPTLPPPPSGRHQWIVGNLLIGLCELAKRQGGFAYPGLAVLSAVMDDWAPYPDIVVESSIKDGDGYTSDPLLIAEVLSPSTLVLDRGRKTEFYQTISSLRFLLLVDQDEVRVEVWRREVEWTMRIAGPGETIDLPELGGSLSVSEIYARLAV